MAGPESKSIPAQPFSLLPSEPRCPSFDRFPLKHPGLFKLMFGQECDRENDERVLASTHLHALLADSLRGIFPHADHDNLATALWALVHGLAFLHLDGKLPSHSDDDVAARVRASFAALRTSFAGGVK